MLVLRVPEGTEGNVMFSGVDVLILTEPEVQELKKLMEDFIHMAYQLKLDVSAYAKAHGYHSEFRSFLRRNNDEDYD